ncbi:kinase-like domain-containing protein [Schizophyllum commune]
MEHPHAANSVELERLRARVERNEPFLPENLVLWRELFMLKPREITSTYLAWAYLTDVFKARGYALYVPRQRPDSTKLYTVTYPAGYMDAVVYPASGNGLGGTHGTLGSQRYISPFYPFAPVWAATNRSGDEFIIKVVSDGQSAKGANELRILERLSKRDVRSDPRNHVVPVVEFVKYKQYTFAVFPRWSDFPGKEIVTPRTAIECCVQITEGLAFLHEKRIAHLDISVENFMINFYGYVHPTLAPVVEHFPIKYGIIDFGESVILDGSHDRLAPPRDYAPRPTSAPEVSSQRPFDPFAADVYQTAMFLLEQFYDLTGIGPDFLRILQAMTGPPSARISMMEVHRRLAALRDSWRDDPNPEVANVIGRPQNKYTRAYLNTRRPFPGSMAIPANDAEASALRERMRQEQRSAKMRSARRPSRPEMLRVDPVRGTSGCVHGNHASFDLDD